MNALTIEDIGKMLEWKEHGYYYPGKGRKLSPAKLGGKNLGYEK